MSLYRIVTRKFGPTVTLSVLLCLLIVSCGHLGAQGEVKTLKSTCAWCLLGKIGALPKDHFEDRQSKLVCSLQSGIRSALLKANKLPEQSTASNLDLAKIDKELHELPAGGRFYFENYAPMAFRELSALYGFSQRKLLESIGDPLEPHRGLREIDNPGKSGSKLYMTYDKSFILKSIEPSEADKLLEMVPLLNVHLRKNPRSLLTKFLGLFVYSAEHEEQRRFMLMSNLMPFTGCVLPHIRYDLKGSLIHRQASPMERAKRVFTLKDEDFLDAHPKGLILEPSIYDELMATIDADLSVLKQLDIMDFSLLMGVHFRGWDEGTEMETHQADREIEELMKSSLWHVVPARTERGESVVLFLGIIDVLEHYGIAKLLEHHFKSIVRDGSKISVQEPNVYSERFRNFLSSQVFVRGA